MSMTNEFPDQGNANLNSVQYFCKTGKWKREQSGAGLLFEIEVLGRRFNTSHQNCNV